MITEQEFDQLYQNPPTDLYNKILYQVQRGMLGLNKGIPTSFAKMDQYTTGIQQGDYILIAGETGAGKTKLARDQFVYIPYEHYLREKLKNPNTTLDVKFLDFSLEMSLEDNMAEFICKKIYEDTNIKITRNNLYSKGNHKLTPFQYQLYNSKKYRDYINEFEKHINIYDEDITPTSYHNILLSYAKRNGTFQYPNEKLISRMGIYTPNNPNLYTIIIIDTINLAEIEGRQTIKQSIDRISRISVWFRKICKFTPIIIQQFGAELSSTERGKYGIKTPIIRDLEDSRRPGKDCSIAFGLFDPVKHNMETILGYDVRQLKGFIRTLHLMKNRNGDDYITVGLQFKGAVGKFQELPPSKKMSPKDYEFYTQY